MLLNQTGQMPEPDFEQGDESFWYFVIYSELCVHGLEMRNKFLALRNDWLMRSKKEVAYEPAPFG